MSDDILSKVARVDKGVQGLQKEVEALRNDLAQRELFAADLTRGFDSIKYSQFYKRFHHEDKEEKDKLAAYLLRTNGQAFEKEPNVPPVVAKPGLKLFCESGSTFSPFISGLTIAIQKGQPPRVEGKRNGFPMTARTNSMLALTAWTNLMSEVFVEPGCFIDDYYGFFPFSNDDSTVDWEREAEAYQAIKRDVGACDRVLATCSHFSLMAGPLVASRANAIFKHAMYTGIGKGQNFALLFAWNKLVLHSAPDAGDDKAWRCVLARRRDLPVDREKIAGWHFRWAGGNIQPIGPQFGKGISTGVENKTFPSPRHLAPSDFGKDWLEIASQITIVIGLGTSKAMDRWKALKNEIAVVESMVDGRFSIQLSDNDVAAQHGVAVLKYRT